MQTDRKGLFTMLRRGERLFNCRQIFVNGGCGSASLGNGPDYQALAAAGVASRKNTGDRGHIIIIIGRNSIGL